MVTLCSATTIGLLFYIFANEEPCTDSVVHPAQWKQALGSTILCMGGDTTGMIVAAVIGTLVGQPMWVDQIGEYVAGFAFRLSSCATKTSESRIRSDLRDKQW